MIDFHCHIDLYPDPPDVLAKAQAKGVYLLAVTTTPLAWDAMKTLAGDNRRTKVALGLHPEVVGERHREIELLERLLTETKYVGEVGLDGSPQYRPYFQEQDKVFRRVLQGCASLGGRVMSIHSRAAVDGVLDALAANRDAGLPILHWFSGSLREVDRAIKLGCWFSVGPTMLASAKGRKLADAMPRDRVLTETDAPFTRGRNEEPLMPWDVTTAEIELANLWSTPLEALRGQLLNNLRQLADYTKTISATVNRND